MLAFGNGYTLSVTGVPTLIQGDKIYVCPGNTYNFTVTPHTTGTWTACASPASGTIAPDDSQTTINVSTITYTPGPNEPANESEFSAEVSVGVIKVEMKAPDAVRRYGKDGKGEDGDIDTDHPVRIKATNSFIFTLHIEKIKGKEGDASFENNKKTMSYTGIGDWENLYIRGLQESDKEANIKIYAEYNGEEIAKDNFIVYSEVDTGFTSDVTQHKDTTEHCKKCLAQGDNVTYPHNTLDEDHIRNDCLNCAHCTENCARCCLYLLFGKTQDFYKRNSGETTLEENHGEGMPTGDIEYYSGFELFFLVEDDYDDVYKRLKSKKEFLGLTGDHTLIVHGCRKNTDYGFITKKMANKTLESFLGRRSGL